jgi:hydrogenase maturation protein HypF
MRDDQIVRALSLHVTGIVQGVGFRPFIYTIATEAGLSGWVLNASDGVHILVEGTDERVEHFADVMRAQAPVMAVIEDVVAEEVDAEGLTTFEIRTSRAEEGAMTLVSPDIATCPDCLAELFDESDRRFHYPFTNCTNCGPRFTIIEDVPYDRAMTTMRDFPMCPQCATEYRDPTDRRFHAQPNACFVCGPRLYLNSASVPDLPAEWRWRPEVEAVPRQHRDRDAERERSGAIVAKAARLLRDGAVVAIRGLGGFHLAVDATNQAAVSALRERKNRWGKPLAIMVCDLDSARRFGLVSGTEAALLEGTVRPIVLLERARQLGDSTAAPESRRGAQDPLAPSVADDLAEIGVMLPYTPLHHLLLQEFDGPLVMTSGNLSEEPIATGNAEALDRLGGIADAFLLHDRDIYSRYDDSVMRVVAGVTLPVRRARGYAPFPLSLPFKTDTPILAAGPEQKNTFALLKEGYAFVSQHIGDMENAETLAAFDQTLRLYQQLFRVDPRVIAYDLHPEYLSTKWALEQGLPTVGVQHHHAHIASVTAEHGVSEPVVGVAFDGTGYGSDGHIWGGEVLLGDWSSFDRFAHLREVPLVGGAAAIRRPARMAVSTLSELGLLEHPGASALRSRLEPGEEGLLLRMIERGVNSPPTSSMGRLFDSIAAITGVRDDARYEGEAAILLEACVDRQDTGSYAFRLSGSAPRIIDPAPVLHAVLDDMEDGLPVGAIAQRFHRAVVDCIVEVSKEAAAHLGTSDVALAGGVFMNRIVAGGATERLVGAGLSPLLHIRLPMNDGAVSYGQAIVAWARRHEI